jgi:hypothetical protein
MKRYKQDLLIIYKNYSIKHPKIKKQEIKGAREALMEQ